MLALLIRLAPFGIVALIGGLVLLHSPFIGLLAMLILIPGEELTTFIAGRTFVWILGVATFGTWLLWILVGRRKIRLAPMPTALAVLWLFWGMASYFWASDQVAAWSRSLTLAQAIAFFILLQNLVTNNKRLRLVAFAYFAAATIYSLFAIGMDISAGFKRVSLAEAQNPAHLAQALGVGLLLTSYMFSWSKKLFWRLLLILGASSITLAILLTGTRTVWVALIAAVGFTWLATRGRAIRIKSLITAGVVLAIGISLLSHYGIITNYTIQRIVTLPSLELTHGGAGRTNIWRVGWEMVKDNPVIGVGLQNFPTRFEDYIDATGLRGAYAIYPSRGSHNIFLSVQGELGILGLIIFVAFLGAIFKALLPYRGDTKSMVGILLLSFLVISGLAITIQYRKYFWLSMGLATLVPMVMRNERN